MNRLKLICVCGILSLSLGGFTSLARADSVSADVSSGYESDNIDLTNATSSFFAYSQQTGVGTNATTFFYKFPGGTVMPSPVTVKTTAIVVRHGLFGLGSTYTSGAAAEVTGVPKQTADTTRQLLNSTSGDFVGKAGQDAGIKGNAFSKPHIWASADNSLTGKTNGSAAGAAFDPFFLPSTSGGSPDSYTPEMNARINLSTDTGGVMYYATDSSLFSDIDNFIQDGSEFNQTLWSLNVDSTGSTSTLSNLEVDFEFNPAAFNEIQFSDIDELAFSPNWFSLSPSQRALLIDQNVDARLALNLAESSTPGSGIASASDFSLFPADTTFAPAGSGVYFADGVEADITGVPLPSVAPCVLLLLAGVAIRRIARKNRGFGGMKTQDRP